MARAAGQAATSPLRRAADAMGESYRSGARGAFRATVGTVGGEGSGASAPAAAPPSSGEPGWARAVRRRQSVHQGASTAAHAVHSGDGGGSGSSVDVSEAE